MLLILGLCLFPLGLVAVLASIDAARDGRAERGAVARTDAVRSASALDQLVAKDALALRIVATSLAGSGGAAIACPLLDRTFGSGPDLVLSAYALIGTDGRRICGRGELSAASPLSGGNGEAVRLDPKARVLRLQVVVDGVTAAGALDYSVLSSLAKSASSGRRLDIALREGDASVQLIDRYDRTIFQRTVVSQARVAGSDVWAVASVGAIPISAAEIATILMPLLMWFAAAALGWLIVDRLLLRPIVRMQQAVLAYRPGGEALAMPSVWTPATEIRDLGDAFTRVSQTVAVHEAELEAGLARQGRLIREVHHRVKNNLQVVASLLNLHARGAKTADAAGAYATIQRRVDALAVVHRNHYAELEDDRGVALRSLLSELTGNLRATAPADASGMAITLELDTVHVNQDVAVSVAFFVTEIVEHAMLCTPSEPVAVSLRKTAPTVARLTLTSESLKSDASCGDTDVRQFERITTGLSRQLRAPLEKGIDVGLYAIDIPIQEAGED